MSDTFTFGVYIISYDRYSQGPITALNFTDYKHVIRKSQDSDYAQCGFDNILAVEDSEIDDYYSVCNYLIDNAEEDVIAIVDDDIKAFQYLLDSTETIYDPEIVQAEFERLAQMIHDLEIGLAFGSATGAPWNYTSEFQWKGIPGAFKVINRECIKSRMSEEFDRNVDIDFVLNELLMNRICLKANWLIDLEYKDERTLVSGSTYDTDGIAKDYERMKLKWGKYYEYNTRQNKPKILVQR